MGEGQGVRALGICGQFQFPLTPNPSPASGRGELLEHTVTGPQASGPSNQFFALFPRNVSAIPSSCTVVPNLSETVGFVPTPF